MKDIIDKLPADPAFWVAVSFTIFVLLAVWRGRKAITTMLDNNIANIKKELSQAEQLKKEAMALHEAAIKKLNEAQKLAADIVTSNHQDGERLLQTSNEKLQQQLAQKEKQLTTRLVQDETRLKAELIKEMVGAAITQSEELLSTTLRDGDGDANTRLLDNSIKKIRDLQ